MSLINFNENIPFMVTSSFFIEKISALIGIAIIMYTVAQAQSILDKINNIEQNVNDLYEEKRRREEANRVNHHFVSTVQSEIAQGIMNEKNLTLNEVCNRIAIEISDYGIRKICTPTVKNF
ncbi:hypothetical protein RhiirA4_472086 [Rhizophagus irregularis]|uniref:Uncharacterized protein n=1 Tax=Rhizophagus irregularis TaxID=588596 RepID=A0A2I1H4B6_9GLOM|nr:hypothetical protein RhiirA4_472086 [Rhizophagus irregularis]